MVICLENRVLLSKARNELASILLSDESVAIMSKEGCLLVNYREYRKALITAYLRRSYRFRIAHNFAGEVQPAPTADQMADAPMCRLVLEKRSISNYEQQKIEAGKRGKIKWEQSKGGGTVERDILLTSGLPGMIMIDGERLMVTCIVKSSEMYQIALNLDNKLITSVALQRGESLNIGAIVRNSHDDSNGIKGLKVFKHKNKFKERKNYFLKIR